MKTCPQKLMLMMNVMESLANEQDDCDDPQVQTLKGDPPVRPICRQRVIRHTAGSTGHPLVP